MSHGVQQPSPEEQPAPRAGEVALSENSGAEDVKQLVVVQSPLLAQRLAASGFSGVIALYRAGSQEFECSDPALCQARSVPASTFKIPNALIALDLGVATGAEHLIEWDGVEREIASWNKNHTLRSAYDASSVPYFQALAREIGFTRYQAALASFNYGNRELGSVVDRFWLDGPLMISPIEQIQFLRRFEQGELPASERSRALVRDIMQRERRGENILRGKTGWAGLTASETEPERGWFVGYVGEASGASYIAVRIDKRPGTSPEAFIPARMALAISVFEHIGVY